MTKFTISTDSCADYFKSYMEKNKIYCIPLKRISGGVEYAEIYDLEAELDAFYQDMRNGTMSSTAQINPEEFTQHFKEILAKEDGDIVYVALSSGVSGTYNSAVLAANQLNPTLDGRKIYVIDSLIGTGGQMMLVEKLKSMRDTTPTAEAVEITTNMRDRLHVLFLVDDLQQLKRGGRLSGAKAMIATVLGIKPILTLDKFGKIEIDSKVRGTAKALEHLLAIIEKRGYDGQDIYIERTSKSELYDQLEQRIEQKYSKDKVHKVILGPVIGAHVGCGTVAIVFQGVKRVDKR